MTVLCSARVRVHRPKAPIDRYEIVFGSMVLAGLAFASMAVSWLH